MTVTGDPSSFLFEPPYYCKSASPILATPVNYYDLLSLQRNNHISEEDVKRAYQRKLLLLHPDKLPAQGPTRQADTVDIALLKEAFTTLFDPQRRRMYDASLEGRAHRRPSQLVSLEDFEVSDNASGSTVYRYVCRCGGYYHISEVDMEADVHFISCETCSEAIWVGYEAVEEDKMTGKDLDL